MSKVLLVVNLQNDYFAGGDYPLWHVEEVAGRIASVIEKANDKHIPVIFLQHLEDGSTPCIPFFKEGSKGGELYQPLFEKASHPLIIKKQFADSFYETSLEHLLADLNGSEVFICGMMTQNSIAHTALSKSAEKYVVKIIADCCTSVDETIHLLALQALSHRVPFTNSKEVFL